MNAPREEEVKPCPFCGDAATARRWQGESLWSHEVVEWLSIGCGGDCDYSMGSELQEKLILRWNTRPRESALLDWVLERAKEKMLYASDGGGVLYSEDLETIINEAKGRM